MAIPSREEFDKAHEKIRLRQALEDAIKWWEVIEALASDDPERGVKFDEGYEPSWLKKARARCLIGGEMPDHPEFAVGDVLLRLDPATLDPVVWDGSVVVTGYNTSARMLIFSCPRSGASGIGNPSFYIRAPDDWQDCPEPPHGAVSRVMNETDGLVQIAAITSALIADVSDDHQAKWIQFYRDRIEWARKHVMRVSPRLALEEIDKMHDALRDAT